ncbi:uncharacterized protein KD926_005816 [Aspergillus affinis]|uniref:uncharacterized protein n=1 Tax=Aspergillus affinis TaxID=1070780 RepID=UPI0022FEDBA1|nr:uncharacterized protein KD926_005816 [Aspergillus affinis]KAI9045873.1 hypothetical protein KD926_005816 [Aspergillus affinis]
MVYTMKFYTDGGCRRNGRPGAVGAAAAVQQRRWGKIKTWRKSLPAYPRPTNQRAEITGIILALIQALKRHQELYGRPSFRVTIYTDSKYAIGCMNEWIYKWVENGWINAAGNEVANRDLIEMAFDLHETLADLGKVRYRWIPREENQLADELCNDDMDEQES